MKDTGFLSKRGISKEFPVLTRDRLNGILADKGSQFPRPAKFHKNDRPLWRKEDIKMWIDLQ